MAFIRAWKAEPALSSIRSRVTRVFQARAGVQGGSVWDVGNGAYVAICLTVAVVAVVAYAVEEDVGVYHLMQQHLLDLLHRPEL